MKKSITCLRCGQKMRLIGTEKIQLGQTGWILGDLSNLLAGAMKVDIYNCTGCGTAMTKSFRRKSARIAESSMISTTPSARSANSDTICDSPAVTSTAGIRLIEGTRSVFGRSLWTKNRRSRSTAFFRAATTPHMKSRYGRPKKNASDIINYAPMTAKRSTRSLRSFSQHGQGHVYHTAVLVRLRL